MNNTNLTLMGHEEYHMQVLRSVGDFGNYNFERWPAFDRVKSLELQQEIVSACSMFTVEPIIVTNHKILFLQKGSDVVMQFDGISGRFSLYGNVATIRFNTPVQNIFQTYFKML